MIRTLLTTTALTVLLTAGAIAQEASPAAPATTTEAPTATDAPAAEAPAPAPTAAPVESGAAVETTDVNEPWDMSAGYTAADTDNLATRLIGQSVFSSPGDDAENIGKVTDLVFNEGGQLTAAIIGVGGFLGIGEKSVAVDFHSLEFTVAADNTERWVLPTTADALTAAPDFVWADDEPADVPADAGAIAPAPVTDGGAMAPAEPAPAAPAQ